MYRRKEKLRSSPQANQDPDPAPMSPRGLGTFRHSVTPSHPAPLRGGSTLDELERMASTAFEGRDRAFTHPHTLTYTREPLLSPALDPSPPAHRIQARVSANLGERRPGKVNFLRSKRPQQVVYRKIVNSSLLKIDCYRSLFYYC